MRSFGSVGLFSFVCRFGQVRVNAEYNATSGALQCDAPMAPPTGTNISDVVDLFTNSSMLLNADITYVRFTLEEAGQSYQLPVMSRVLTYMIRNSSALPIVPTWDVL